MEIQLRETLSRMVQLPLAVEALAWAVGGWCARVTDFAEDEIFRVCSVITVACSESDGTVSQGVLIGATASRLSRL